MHPLKILATTVGAALLVWGVLFAYVSSPAWADTITVNTTADEQNTNTQCSLREAIINANADNQSGSSDCAAGSGADVINIRVSGTVNLSGVLPDLSSNIEIKGPGAGQFTVRRNSGGNYRIFSVTGDTTVVTISGMTISNGNIDPGTAPGSTEGGGIFNGGTLTVTDSTISSNTATGGTEGSLRGKGGGIDNHGTLTVTDSTISANTAAGTVGGGEGGGIDNHGTALSGETTATITNSTISGNAAATGGGVYNVRGLTVIEFSTITDNISNSVGGGVFSFEDQFTRTEVLSTIISANRGLGPRSDVDSLNPNVPPAAGTFASKGYNLIGEGSAKSAFRQPGDMTAVTDPGLDPLGSYGGPTQTHRLQSDSPAIDAGPPTDGNPIACAPPDTDQRGVTRPQDGDADSTPTCDIGSFELEEPTDTTAPKVISTFPANGGEVGPAANIRATFSEDMRTASVLNAFKLFKKGSTNQIDAQVSYDAATDRATLNPNNNLRRGVTYKAVVSTVAKDVAGNRLDQDDSTAGLQQKVWFFEID